MYLARRYVCAKLQSSPPRQIVSSVLTKYLLHEKALYMEARAVNTVYLSLAVSVGQTQDFLVYNNLIYISL